MRIEINEARYVPSYSSKATPARDFGQFAPPRRQLSANEARTLLSNAWAEIIGILPEPGTSAVLTAHWALETDGGRSMPGYNFGGIKATPAAPGTTLSTLEGHGATQRQVLARFRSYESAEAGARDYVTLLATRYPDAVAAARAGDVAGFAAALARSGYFTADPAAYAAGLEWRLQSLTQGSSAATTSCAGAPGVLARMAFEGVLHMLQRPTDEG